MAFTEWRQTFKRDGVLLKNAAVFVYLAGTSISARIFDPNGDLHDEAPQAWTDSAGYVFLSLEEDFYPTGQLFDVLCQPDARCNTQNEVRLPSLQILQDTEGYRNYRNIFAQDALPTVGMRENDLWFDTDNNNEPYRYDGTNWVSARDGTIATAANTANWSQVVDDDTHRPDNDADVTAAHDCQNPGDYTAGHGQGWPWITGSKPDQDADKTSSHTSNNTTYVNESQTQAAHVYNVYGDLRMRNGADISLYNESDTYKGGLYSWGTQIRLTSSGSVKIDAQGDVFIGNNLLPTPTNTYYLGTTTYRWKGACFHNAASINFGKVPSGLATVLTMNSSNQCFVGGECAACVLGNNCTVNNPVYIRINGSNAQQLIRSPDTDSNGKHYVTLN